MFTINIYLRLALIGVLLVGGVLLAFLFGFWYSFPFILIGVFLLVGYILFGTVQSAALLMQNADFDKTEERLKLTLNPKWLYPTNRAYYYMIKGSIAMARKDMDGSEEWLRKAQDIKLPTDNEKAMLELQLANIMASRNKWKQAQVHMRNLKKLKVTESTIREQIAQLEKAFTNRGQIEATQRLGQQGMAMRPGGKRRRPKLR